MIGQGAADPQWKILGGAITVDSGGTTALVDASVSQSKLKTSSGEVSVSVPAEGTASTSALPGGYYGFLPEVKTNNASGNIFLSRFYKACSTSYAAVACEFHNTHPTTAYTGYANQYYVTASGEVFWIFILRDKDTKQILHVWAAPDHPCFGTSGDPSVTPHPFAGIYDKVKHEIIVINPTRAEEIFINNNKKDSFIESLFELYDINEESSISWPNKEITLGLPKDRDWRFVLPGTLVVPIKKQIPKPNYILCKSLRRKVIRS